MQIAIVGPGGIGGLLATNLSPRRHDIHPIARGAHLEAIRARRLRFPRPNWTETLVDVPASDDFAAVASADLVFICVKTVQLTEAIEGPQGVARPGTIVVTPQTGVEAPFQVADASPDQVVVLGVAKVIALIEESVVIRYVGGADAVVAGDLDGHVGPADKVRAASPDSAVRAEEPPVASSGSLEEVPLRRALRWAGSRHRSVDRRTQIHTRLAGDCDAIQCSKSNRLPERASGLNDDEIKQTMRFAAALRHQFTATRPCRDAPSELDARTGAIVRLEDQSGVPTPVNTVMHQLLDPRLAQ